MISHTSSHYSYPADVSRLVLSSVEEIVGHNGLNAVLNQAELSYLIGKNSTDERERSIAFEEISRIQLSLEQLYGPRGGRGLALRAGRVFFKTALFMYGDELGITDKDFRLLALDKKISAGMDALATLFNTHTDQRVQVVDHPEVVIWSILRCPFCWNRSSDAHVCYFVVGMLQESLYWLSGGRNFFVEEVECVAKGDLSCKVAVAKNSLD